jgi:undecaprenyl phosphate N,N'-diacetylbacillosamine 1-phosphate transferase
MYKCVMKRTIDIVISLIAFPFWLILMIFISPMIICQDKGPVFYNAPRLGKNGKIFMMHKFRSMKNLAADLRNSDGSTYNSDHDPRVTRIGKYLRRTSLDETPQLLNILKGDMSIIGPRPDLPEHRLLYQGNEARKLDIRPGVTGYNQAYFRNTIPWKERIKNDIYYIDHLSFKLDLVIFFRTVISVIKREKINANE